MKKFFKLLAAPVIALALTMTPASKAHAGIILAPTGVGIILIVLGVMRDNLTLLILDGSSAQSNIEKELSRRYTFIDDQQAIRDLAGAITKKFEAQGKITQEVEIKLDKGEILDILAPTGLIELQPAKVQNLINELG